MNAPLASRLPSVVALGGGHGLAASLRALRRVTSNLTAVVTVADDGGSSGGLREQFDILPPGDLRMALAALCGDDHEGRLWVDVLQSRFGGNGPLAGHAIGNLLIAGIWERLGDTVAGLDMVARLLEVQGRVLPMASVPLHIEADVLGADPAHPLERCLVHGQARVAKCPGEVMEVRLVPTEPPACPESVEAVRNADHIVLGPGSWFTSVLVHLLVPELADAITTTAAKRTLTMNLVSADETAGFSASHHLEVLAEHAPTLRLDTIVCDPTYAEGDGDLEGLAASLGAELVVTPLRASDGSPRHDVNRLASVYSDLIGR